MPKPTIWMPRLLVASFAAVSILASSAFAQQAPTVRIRGTIESVDGNMLGIKTREGTDVKVKMTDNVAVFAVVKTELSQIKEGSYIGVTAMPEPDGVQKAIAVHIFPENQRGAAEGFRPWDARANSTMTNATVAETVKGHFQQQGRDARHFEATLDGKGAFRTKAEVGGGGSMDVKGSISDKESRVLLDGYCKFEGKLEKK